LAALPPRPWPSILLVGPTGAGKSPLGDEMERRGFRGRPCLHFDFGANLRAAAEGRADGYGLTGPERETIRRSLATGALFETGDMPMIVKILTGFAALRRLGPASLLVLNGLPRHRSQAEALTGIVAVEWIVSFEAEAAVISERIRLDPGRDRSGRTDDDAGSVARRLATFLDRTAPLLDLYRERGVPVRSIAVTAAMSSADMYDELARPVTRP
jgi:adenylate kinase family enzyme